MEWCVHVWIALASHMSVMVHRDGKLFQQEYERGKPLYPVKTNRGKQQRGTIVTFTPDSQIFITTDFNFEILATRLRELAYLNKGIRLKNYRQTRNWRKRQRNGNGNATALRQNMWTTETVPAGNIIVKKVFIRKRPHGICRTAGCKPWKTDRGDLHRKYKEWSTRGSGPWNTIRPSARTCLPMSTISIPLKAAPTWPVSAGADPHTENLCGEIRHAVKA